MYFHILLPYPEALNFACQDQIITYITDMGTNTICFVYKMFVQIQSFEAELLVPELASKEGGPETFRGIFIRAPAVLEVGPEVEVLVDYSVPSNKVLYSSSTVEIQEVRYVLFFHYVL